MSATARDAARHYLHPYTDVATVDRDGPLVITSGKGIRVYDDAGNAYIDCHSGRCCASLGYGDERLVEAAAAQMRKLSYCHSWHRTNHDRGLALAAELIRLAPAPMEKVFFTNSGSEANDTAVKLVWYCNNATGRPEKKKIIAQRGSYHGGTIGASSLSGLPDAHRGFDLPIPGILFAEQPYYAAHGSPGESEEAYAERLAEALDRQIRAEGPHTVAAFLAEPVMGSAGMVPPPRGYFEKVQAVLRAHDVLFIVDEVICGFGRTGQWWGSQTYGIEPDIVTLAKPLTAAYLPMGAVLMSAQIADGIAKGSTKLGGFSHGFTNTGHPVCSAVALEVIRIIEADGIVRHVREVAAPRLHAGLRALQDHPLVGAVRGAGLLTAGELVRDKGRGTPFAPEARVGAFLERAARRNGLLLRTWSSSFAFAPPLIITAAEIDDMLARTRRALDETAQWLEGETLEKAS